MEHQPAGIVDVGSNTVLGVVFRWDGEKKATAVFLWQTVLPSTPA